MGLQCISLLLNFKALNLFYYARDEFGNIQVFAIVSFRNLEIHMSSVILITYDLDLFPNEDDSRASHFKYEHLNVFIK